MSKAISMTRIPHVSALKPPPFQPTETKAAATLAIEAMVIQPE